MTGTWAQCGGGHAVGRGRAQHQTALALTARLENRRATSRPLAGPQSIPYTCARAASGPPPPLPRPPHPRPPREPVAAAVLLVAVAHQQHHVRLERRRVGGAPVHRLGGAGARVEGAQVGGKVEARDGGAPVPDVLLDLPGLHQGLEAEPGGGGWLFFLCFLCVLCVCVRVVCVCTCVCVCVCVRVCVCVSCTLAICVAFCVRTHMSM